jgi:hypothetical protein
MKDSMGMSVIVHSIDGFKSYSSTGRQYLVRVVVPRVAYAVY